VARSNSGDSVARTDGQLARDRQTPVQYFPVAGFALFRQWSTMLTHSVTWHVPPEPNAMPPTSGRVVLKLS